MLLWLLQHDKIMTNLERMKRGFTANPHCLHCPSQVEDLNHVFRDCIKATSFWAKIAVLTGVPTSSSLSFQGWLDWNVQRDRLPGSND